MSKYIEVYKVGGEKRSNNIFYSHINYYAWPFVVKYKLNETSYPIIGGLFAFNSLDSAVEFANNKGSFKTVIYKCLAKKIKDKV